MITPQNNMADEEEEDVVSFQNGIKSCIMHFGDVRETLNLITKLRLEKFMSCRRRWVNLQGEQAAICQKSYETFSDETARKVLDNEAHALQWRYHKTCYERLCDEEKIRRGEAKIARNPAVLEQPEETEAAAETERRKAARCLRTRSTASGPTIAKKPRNSHVLPEQCIICCREGSLDRDRQRNYPYNWRCNSSKINRG